MNYAEIAIIGIGAFVLAFLAGYMHGTVQSAISAFFKG